MELNEQTRLIRVRTIGNIGRSSDVKASILTTTLLHACIEIVDVVVEESEIFGIKPSTNLVDAISATPKVTKPYWRRERW